MPKLSPEEELILAYGGAASTAVRLLVISLQNNGALKRGQYPDELRWFMETSKDTANEMTLALLHELRVSILN